MNNGEDVSQTRVKDPHGADALKPLLLLLLLGSHVRSKKCPQIKSNTLNRWSRNPKFIPTISDPILLSFL